MATDKQIDANRRNAQLSSGPKSSEGKARSARNAISHGLCASDFTLLEDPETKQDVQNCIDEYFHAYQPDDLLFRDLLERLALVKVRLRRVARAETGLLNAERERVFADRTFLDPAGNTYHQFDPSNYAPGQERDVATMHLGVTWQKVSDTIDRMSRYEHRLQSQFWKIFKEVQKFASIRVNSRPENHPEPEAPEPEAPEPEAPEPEASQNTVQNEPNLDLTPSPASPPPSPGPEPPEPFASIRVDSRPPNQPSTPVNPDKEPDAVPRL
jgi:hypothetical protein